MTWRGTFARKPMRETELVDWTTKIDAGGRDKLSYIERPGEGLPILFLHGSGFCKEVFLKQFAGTRLADRHLLALDLPGHGQSADAEDPDRTYSYAGLAESVAGFINRLKLDQCIVVGWSLGGHVAYDLLKMVPGVAGLMAFGAPPTVAGPLGVIRSLHISRTLLLISKATFTAADAERFERVCFGEHSKGEFVEALMRTDARMRPSLSRSVMRGFGPGQKEEVEKSHKPICLLHGGQDPIVSAGYMQSIRGLGLYHGRTIVLPGSGHAPFFDSPTEFDELLNGFVGAVEYGCATDELANQYRQAFAV